MNDLPSLRDAYLRSFPATVVEARGEPVAFDRTAFYATRGGPPNDSRGCRRPSGTGEIELLDA